MVTLTVLAWGNMLFFPLSASIFLFYCRFFFFFVTSWACPWPHFLCSPAIICRCLSPPGQCPFLRGSHWAPIAPGHHPFLPPSPGWSWSGPPPASWPLGPRKAGMGRPGLWCVWLVTNTDHREARNGRSRSRGEVCLRRRQLDFSPRSREAWWSSLWMDCWRPRGPPAKVDWGHVSLSSRAWHWRSEWCGRASLYRRYRTSSCHWGWRARRSLSPGPTPSQLAQTCCCGSRRPLPGFLRRGTGASSSGQNDPGLGTPPCSSHSPHLWTEAEGQDEETESDICFRSVERIQHSRSGQGEKNQPHADMKQNSRKSWSPKLAQSGQA